MRRRRLGMCVATLIGLLAVASPFCGCSESDEPAEPTDAGPGGAAGSDGGVDAEPDTSPSCPSGDGDYCGDASLGQDPGSLYGCAQGQYTLSSNCGGLGCQPNAVGQDDKCNVAEAGSDASVDASPDGGDDAGSDSGIVYGTPGQSCHAMTGTECQGESCCTNIPVPGGVFPMGRSVAGTDAHDGPSNELPEHNVTVSDFYLDEYEVTVGRFRAFVQQHDGTPPPDGAAAHPLIAGSGWQSTWNTSLAASQAALMANLKCNPTFQTWRDTPSGTEELPINCVSWYEAFAFCAWDGGRIPTEAEWEYVSAGGSENRLYPWGSAAPDITLLVFACLYAGTSSCTFEDIAPVGVLPAGAGRWGHKDLAGSMWELTLDWYDSGWYAGDGSVCNDCANLNTASGRVVRGGHHGSGAIRVAFRSNLPPTDRASSLSFRCARNP